MKDNTVNKKNISGKNGQSDLMSRCLLIIKVKKWGKTFQKSRT